MFPFGIISDINENRPVRGLISTAMSSKTLGWETFIQTIHSLQKPWITWAFVSTNGMVRCDTNFLGFALISLSVSPEGPHRYRHVP